MKVVILAGGTGSRMSPIEKPKMLLSFLGKPLIEWQMEKAERAGFDDFIVIGNPNNIDQIKEKISEKFQVGYAVQEEPRGMGNALLQAEHLIKDEPILVLNPNDLFEIGAYKQLNRIRERKNADSYIVGHKVEEYFPGGYLVTNEKGRIKGIEEKPGKGNEPSNLVNLVIHLHENPRKLFSHLKGIKDHYSYELALDKMIKKGYGIQAVPYAGYWAAIKYPWHIFRANRYFLNRKLKGSKINSNKIDESAKIEGKVFIGKGTKVLENAVIRGPAYIGKDCLIGNNALIRDYSHICKKSVVGYSTEIKNSYIGKDTWFHSNYIGDSIIGDNCSLGAGTITANFRFDEKKIEVNVKGKKKPTKRRKFGAIMGKNCKTGVNVSIMPGTKIGPGSIVGPNVFLRKDVEKNKFCYRKGKLKRKRNKLEKDQNKDELRKNLKV